MVPHIGIYACVGQNSMESEQKMAELRLGGESPFIFPKDKKVSWQKQRKESEKSNLSLILSSVPQSEPS